MNSFVVSIQNSITEQTAQSRINCSFRHYSLPFRQILDISSGLVVQCIVSLMSLITTNSLTVVAKVFSNSLIFLLQKCE